MPSHPVVQEDVVIYAMVMLLQSTTSQGSWSQPEEILSRIFGYTTFRSVQREIIEHVIKGRDALVLMPTGGGKSLCYQIPALLRPGLAIVVSPLIALMKDQVDGLRELGVQAACLHSALTLPQMMECETAIRQGQYSLLYLSPERLLNPRTSELLAKVSLSLIAVDEAHCVSQWGHDFRPEYMQLRTFRRQFPKVPVIALTATADEPTRREILSALELENAAVYCTGFDRPNITYRIGMKRDPKKQLLNFIEAEHARDAGIVYCSSRKRVEETARFLKEAGIRALPYHAGLSREERERSQDEFIRDEGIVVVATIAFGMGIDKPNVRFVAHIDLPKSIEAYYQETGRAGRDGLPATAWMIYGYSDVVTVRQMVASSEASEERKRVENRKLNALLGLCETVSCRRQVLLAYFGDKFEAPCGKCDTCLSPVEQRDGTKDAQKALSAVFRTGQKFGVGHIIDVLVGAENEKIKRFGHHELALFGIGREVSRNDWSSIFRQLVARGILTVDVDGYGSLHLTEEARPILRGEASFALRLDSFSPRKKSRKKGEIGSSETAEDAQTQATFERLKQRRLVIAREQGVPPYIIFHDATLREMAIQRPQTLVQMRDIPGVGEKKLQKYGEIFLSELYTGFK